MATYRNRNDEETIYMPAEFKLNVSMEPIEGYHMEDVDFICIFYTGSRNLIPVRKGTVGYLYDKVSGQLFGNANSTGAFTLGPDVT